MWVSSSRRWMSLSLRVRIQQLDTCPASFTNRPVFDVDDEELSCSSRSLFSPTISFFFLSLSLPPFVYSIAAILTYLFAHIRRRRVMRWSLELANIRISNPSLRVFLLYTRLPMAELLRYRRDRSWHVSLFLLPDSYGEPERISFGEEKKKSNKTDNT